MLYVFHVDTGRMLTFEMSKALEIVRSLKETIERHHGIPCASIVLLVSGGEVLQDTQRVCNYSAGTDTNPIYMFSKSVLDARNQPAPWPSIETDNDLKAQVDKCLELPATYNTVVTRSLLAQQICEMAKEEAKTCETLIHEQHLQQQGWAAVVANMEDSVMEFQERVADFYRRYEEHRQRFTEHMEILSAFDHDLKQLSEIPILSTLMENAASRPFGNFDEAYVDAGNTANSTSSGSVKTTSNSEPATAAIAAAASTTDAEGTTPSQGEEKAVALAGSGSAEQQQTGSSGISDKDKAKCISLLDWISASEGQRMLKRMAEECTSGLEQFEKHTVGLKQNIDKAVEASQRGDIKEIKGLEERLCDLDKVMYEARKIVSDQNELAQSFQQNQNRANTLGDTSILPDLCASHKSQLIVMLQNHKNLRDIRRRCAKCKEELGNNLFQRLRYIIHVETRVWEIDNSILFYHTSLKRLQKHLGIIEQIHMAPCMYVSAVTEVVRRRMFSSSFLRWASDLACRLMTIHNEEVMRRHEFTAQFEGHFLSTLFPGMDDMPPSYAIQAPSIFDSSLPALNKRDLQELSTFLPELTEKIQLPNIDSVIDFFSSRSVEGTNQSKSSGLQEYPPDMGAAEPTAIDGKGDADSATTAQQPTKEGCESETDTEEFEKVGQSPIDRRRRSRSKVPPVDTCSMATSTERVLQASAETLTEENLGTTRLEVEKLKTILRTVYQLSQSSISFLREQLSAVRTESASNRAEFRSKLEAINRAWAAIQEEARNRERETIQQLTVDHELEMNDLRKSIHQKDDEMQSLRSDNSMIKASHIETVSKYESEKRELNVTVDEMKEVVRKLEQRLADVEVDRKKAIQEAVEQLEHKHKTEIESLRCRYKLMTSMDRSPSDTSLEKIEKPDMIDIASHEQLLAQAREDFNREKERAIKTAIEEERQRWESSTVTIKPQQRSMASSPGTPTGSHDIYKRILEEKERQLDELRDKESVLIRENQRYKETIQSLTDPELGSNQLNLKEQLEALEREKQQLSRELERHQNRPSGGVSIQSCSKGDLVMIVYNSTYDQYTIVQNAPVLYFLHADSYAAFGLTELVAGQVPRIIHCMGTVVDKDYCHARKDGNRYKVSRGTRFYRVKVKPVPGGSGGSSGGGSSASLSASVSSGTSRSAAADSDKHSHKKEKSKMSRSSSTITEQGLAAAINSVVTSTTTTTGTSPGLLIDSFAQTEQLGSPLGQMEDSAIKTSASRDMIDSGVAEQNLQNQQQQQQRISTYKERNISVTDDEDVGYGGGAGSASASVDESDSQQQQTRLRYESVCEEEQPEAEEEQEDVVDQQQQPAPEGGNTTAPNTRLSPLPELTGDTVDAPSLSVFLSTSTGSSIAEELVATSTSGAGSLQQLTTLADDVSDSADSEYRSLETKDDDDDEDYCLE
ncbi:RB1-inducible coiled-coil protein 1 isoform X1 [Culex pipiens pallens]|uniref:RB1-inducible coiled-coil protein 1 isoform X1 n=1 Tax=Culex pipiens pallens TaxID=42434 RepID=UPI0019540E18|nr:RB1-inducible coiled-coil protein 1 isoform X1 [Culex pipiens pallens]XP_039431972.1 RB1-inducible coiled-coil protein 1 isoform X1 [Culex pipiens pallens]XP_039431973.1 RB1-inducible coiled-coil protein 1 isoform X1 [Culex pipiens pallens]XP_052563269.1 RB1-inducible coiled-coil protein 1 isoform X1 [Culex pipiens pallens]